ncbi:MAG: hemA [Gammaproteobacteria bacterium]|jgi:glutamyl-tRNA reductase|nr:hemA [Gammaproteobacteria bacterium]
MPIIVCGINHKTAPVALREQITFPPEKIALYLNDLLTQEDIHEAVLLSTCNRSELYCVAEDVERVTEWFCRQHPLTPMEILPLMYLYRDQAAIEHIMNVACGLDSMVLGESEVLRQMKDAFSESCAASTVGTLFNRLFQEVFAVTKEIRTTTAIGACPVSVSSAAVNFIKEIYPGQFNQATVLVMGAGVTADLVMRYLKSSLPHRILIANRSAQNAAILAKKYQCDYICLTKLAEALIEADIVISATGSPAPVILKSMLVSRKKSLFIIDIAVPRDVEPAVSELDFIHLYSIDDLKTIIQQNVRGREHAAEKAREIIKQKSHDFMMWLNSLDKVATTIRAYRNQVEDLCRIELSKAEKQLRRGDNPAEVLASFSHALTNKLLHTPTVQLRQAGHEGRLEILKLAQELFAISGPESELI